MLQVCFDDSGKLDQGKTSWIAGYAARTGVWEDFSDRWDAALRAAPAIQYFKMSDAFALTREFRGWTRDAMEKKVHSLIDVVVQTDFPYAMAVALHNADYLSIAKGTITEPFSDHFYFLFIYAIEQTFVHHWTEGIEDSVDFIFDESNKGLDEVMSVWSTTMASAPPELRRFINGPPIFRDDKRFMPLQAADLLAGQLRNYYHKGDPSRGVASRALQRLADHTNVKIAHHDARTLSPFFGGLKHMETLTDDQKLAFLMQTLADTAKRLDETKGAT